MVSKAEDTGYAAFSLGSSNVPQVVLNYHMIKSFKKKFSKDLNWFNTGSHSKEDAHIQCHIMAKSVADTSNAHCRIYSSLTCTHVHYACMYACHSVAFV